jgi:hypothetical protein
MPSATWKLRLIYKVWVTGDAFEVDGALSKFIPAAVDDILGW